ncbi:MAG TPA: hypothetical protein VEI07_10785 [Planctomycetaceae bacterium]|nr:hypothetical protein [Planctomycetaceae bacterium]
MMVVVQNPIAHFAADDRLEELTVALGLSPPALLELEVVDSVMPLP